ncbi:MAG: site-specific integrase [Candidatus Velthaea sp.]
MRGEGSIFKRASDGRWVGRFTARAGGLARRHTVYADTRAEVSEKLRILREQIIVGIDPARKNARRVKDAVQTWLADVKRTKRSSTHERYELVARHVLKAIGDVRLIDVNADTVRALDDELVRSGATAAARRSARTTLSAALSVAVREGHMRRNPIADVPPPNHEVERIAPLSAADAGRLVAASAGERLGAMYVVAVTAGLRLGELFGLKAEDIDLKRGVLRVSRSLRETATGVVEHAPKTAKGRRTVALTPTAVAILKRHMATAEATASYVFTADRGGPLRKSVFTRKEWKPFLERHDLPRTWTVRQLRHTAATLMAESGAHPRFVMEQLGHTSSEMSVGTYTHASPEMQRQAVSGIDQLLREVDTVHAEVHERSKTRLEGRFFLVNHAHGGIRTPGLSLRRAARYPATLRARGVATSDLRVTEVRWLACA